MYTPDGLYMGLSEEGQRVYMKLNMCNRHGIITGASGTGKTITMKVMAESFADAGVPVFLCDIKGDVSGLCMPGTQNEGMEKRIDKFGIRDIFKYTSYQVTHWDIYGEKGHPIRATLSDMGPDLLARILQLSQAQEGVLQILFKYADDKGLELYDLKDLTALIEYVSDHREELSGPYGNIAAASLGTIQRALIPLANQGGDVFFGEPMMDIFDFMRTTQDGKGMINLLNCVKLVNNPTLYATFLLWLMAELFERLPEAGDLDKPKLVFFFDEAHMLFTDAPKILVQKVEQLVKLIRSKAVGIYFVTQSPSDIPDPVLAQLSNRVQHALRAYTPAEQKNIRAAAQSLRANPAFDTAEVITQLGVGHALLSFLDEEGVPGVTQNCSVLCPQSLMAQADQSVIDAAIAADGMHKYDQAIDRDSAYEKIERERAAAPQEEAQSPQESKEEERKRKEEEKRAAKEEREREKREAKEERARQRRRDRIERQLLSTGAQILKRGLFNTLLK